MADGYLNTPENSPGLFVGAQPDWQLRQKALDATNAFQGGMPTDAYGNVDYMGAAKTLMQKGAFEPAKMLMELGLQQQGIAATQAAADRFEAGSRGGAPAGGPAYAPAAAGGAPGRSAGSSLPVFAGAGGMGPAPGANGVGLTNTVYRGPLDQPGAGGVSPMDHFNFLKSQGATDNEALMLTGAAANESSFNPNAWHDKNKDTGQYAGYGMYGHNMGRLDMRGMGWQDQAKAALGELRSRPEIAAVNAAKSPGELARAQMAFEQPMGYTAKNPEGGLNYSGRANTIARFMQMAGGSPSAPANPQVAAAPPSQQPQAPSRVASINPNFVPGGAPTLSPGSTVQGGVAVGPNIPASANILPGEPGYGAAPAQGAQNGAPVTTPVQVAQNGDSDGPIGAHPYGPAATATKTQAQVDQGAGPQVAQSGAQPSGQVPQAAAPQPSFQPVAQNTQSGLVGPTTGLDPTLGGLLKGQWVGNPGGYVTALRAEAMRLGMYPTGKGPAEAYNKQADFIERELARNGIITPEMKNYQVAQQQGFKGTMADFAAYLESQKARATASGKLAVEGSPQAIAAKSAEAQAAASGGAQGKLAVEGSPEAIRAAGQMTQAKADAENAAKAGAASQIAEQEGQGKYLGELPGKLAAAADSAKLQSNLVDQMMNAGEQFRMGWGADAQQNFRKKLLAVAGALNVDPGNVKEQTAGFEDFNKLAGQLTRQSIKDTGSNRAGIQEMQLVSGTLPSPEMTSEGFKTVAGQLKGLADFTLAKQQAGDAWLNAKGTMNGFEADWNKNATPAAFVLARLQSDQPELFQTALAQLSATPAGRNVLAHVKASRAWGKAQGLF